MVALVNSVRPHIAALMAVFNGGIFWKLSVNFMLLLSKGFLSPNFLLAWFFYANIIAA